VRTHHLVDRLEFSALLATIRGSQNGFIANPVNELRRLKLSPSYPQGFVDKLWKDFAVGDPQRQEIKQRRGFRRGAFGYNEGPTSSCHTFCWKARQFFDVPFFCSRPGSSTHHVERASHATTRTR
jgi:hypothetical protein